MPSLLVQERNSCQKRMIIGFPCPTVSEPLKKYDFGKKPYYNYILKMVFSPKDIYNFPLKLLDFVPHKLMYELIQRDLIRQGCCKAVSNP